jgi:hypothetical protein
VPPEFASTDIDGKYTTYDLRRKYGKLFRSYGVSVDPLSEVSVAAQAKGRCLGRLHREQARPHSSTHAHRAAAGECRVYPKRGEGDAAAANATKDEVPKKNSLRIEDKVNSHSIFGKYQSRLPTKSPSEDPLK